MTHQIGQLSSLTQGARRTLDTSQEAVRIAQEQADALLAETLGKARQEFALQLKAERQSFPEIHGNAEAVIPHHFGELLPPSEVIEKLARLEAQIAASCGPDEYVPLVCCLDYEEFLDEGTSQEQQLLVGKLATADATDPFRSTWQVRNQRMHAFTSTLGVVETTCLTLRSSWAKKHRVINDHGLCLRERDYSPEASVCSSTYAFSNSTTDIVLNFREQRDVRSMLLVGWKEIAANLHRFSRSEFSAIAAGFSELHVRVTKASIIPSPLREALALAQSILEQDEALRGMLRGS